MRWTRHLVVLASFAALVACSDAAKAPFEAAAALDRQQQAEKAVALYVEAGKAAPDSRFGKLARARAEVILLELGAQQVDAARWEGLERTAGSLLELDASSPVGNLYKAYAAFEGGRAAEAERLLELASGELRGVTPPSESAVEATAVALFSGATAGASSALGGSVVDGAYLNVKRNGLKTRIEREREASKRRAELLADGSLDAMATLLTSYRDSPEAAKVRPTYAEAFAAKLASPEKVGPPTEEDPDPISSIVDALSSRVSDEPAAKSALANVDKLRSAWEKRYEEETKSVDERLEVLQEKAMQDIAHVIRDKCTPLRMRFSKGDASAAEPLAAAREEATRLIPNGMTEEDLNKVAQYVLVNCTLQETQ